MALLAGLVIAALPDRAALTLAMVPSASISASFTTSTIRLKISLGRYTSAKFASERTRTFEWSWVQFQASLTDLQSVLSAIGKIGFAQFCKTGRLGECMGCLRPSRWWWSDMGVVAGRRGGGCDEGPHSWCATDAHYAAFCSPFLNLHKCFRHLHLYFFHVQKYLSLFHNFKLISKKMYLFFPSTRMSTFTRILWVVHFINCEQPSGWFNTLLKKN